MRKIFGPERGEVKGDWGKLHNEELFNFQSWLNIIRMIKTKNIEWVEYVARIGVNINAYRFLVGKPEGKRQLGTSQHK
jgi:hypothetical protein